MTLKKIALSGMVVAFALSAKANDLQQELEEQLEEELAADTIDVAADAPLLEIEGSAHVDSLISAWYSQRLEAVNDFMPDSVQVADSIIMGTPDSVFVARLQAIPTPIPMTYNEQVKRFIELYIVKRRDQVQKMLGLAQYYFPMFEEVLDANQMPLELKFLPIIESALNTRARSRVGAMGLWQFMYYTGKRYGLNVNSFVDDRCNPRKATEAAARFLKDLYSIYGDWHLAIAAYNCGPGNVNRAIARSGGARDFWKIYYNLPRETRGYVPAFIAAAYAMTYAQDHQLYPLHTQLPTASDTIMVTRPLHFEQVSQMLHIPVEMLRDLNPQYRYDVVPAQAPINYEINLPVELSFTFAANEDTIYAFNRSKYFPDNKVVPVSEAVAGAYVPANSAKLIYTVKSGDVPGGIANRFGVSLSNLKYWNGMRRNIIRVGQKLTIYVPKSKVDRYSHMARVVK